MRGLAIAVIAVLSLTGALEIWHMLILVAIFGGATAFFGPAFDAVVPDVLPASLLPQANSLDQFVRPLALRLAGPAVGGFLIEGVGVGWAFALNAATFAVSAAALLAMAPPTRRGRAAGGVSVAGDIKVGFAYVRKHVWLWGTFASAAVAYLCFMGPAEVLLPFLVKNDLHGSAADLGLVFAAGGIGSLGCAAIMGQRGIPRRDITFMYLAWTLATVAIAGYGLATAVWQLMIASIAFNGAGDGRHDRVGHRQAAPRPARAARPRLEPRLADLDRAAAAVVRAHRAGELGPRRPGDADRRRRGRRRRDVRRAAAARDAGGRGQARRPPAAYARLPAAARAAACSQRRNSALTTNAITTSTATIPYMRGMSCSVIASTSS